MRKRKENFTLMSLHDWCPPATPVMRPRRDVPPFFLTALTDHLFKFSALPHMVPIESICVVDFVDSRQAYDGASSQYRQDPARLIITPDMQSSSERNTKMAAACSICLHVATSDASTS